MKQNNLISEKYIIDKYLKKLHFNRVEAHNFNNDGAFLQITKNRQIVVTNDTIVENIDFFYKDPPESIANKIVTCNLSDISSMGSDPYCYTLSLCLPKKISENWLKQFTKKLSYLQKKYNFFLIGGDISMSENIVISSNFFGIIQKGKILNRIGAKNKEHIWVTGNLGESFIGLKIKQKKIKIKINSNDKKYYINKYLFPTHSSLGNKITNIASSAIDISDGLYGDVENLIKKNNIGAFIDSKLIPFTNKTKKLIKRKVVSVDELLSSGDDYEIMFTSKAKNASKIKRLGKKNNIKITRIGEIVRQNGIYLDNKKIKMIKKSFDHFR